MLLPLKNNFTMDVNGRRLTYLVTLLNDEPTPEGGNEHKPRKRGQVRRLYELGADVSLISELTSLSHEDIYLIVPGLAPCLVSAAQPTKQGWGWLDGKRVSFDEPKIYQEIAYFGNGFITFKAVVPSTSDGVSPKPSPVFPGYLVVYNPLLEKVLHYKEGVEPVIKVMRDKDGSVIKHDMGEPPIPPLKERLIDSQLKFEDIYPSLLPAVRERAINTFNGFQGTPEEKAKQAITHAYTELSTGN